MMVAHSAATDNRIVTRSDRPMPAPYHEPEFLAHEGLSPLTPAYSLGSDPSSRSTYRNHSEVAVWPA